MNRIVCAIVGIVSLVWIASAQAADTRQPLDVKSIIAKGRKGVVRVENLDVSAEAASASYGGGSGFVFEVDYDKGIAYAITNNHVSGKAAAVGVTFWNRDQYPAELVAREPGIDIALIRIKGIPDERNLSEEEKTIVPVVLGDSDQVRPGDLGVSMGSPGANDAALVDRSNPAADFMMDQTANVNVISGRDSPADFGVWAWEGGRNELGWQYGTNLPFVFRMSTTINHGNSGGPLFNSRGEVVAINTWGLPVMSQMQAHNWSVPINYAKDFALQTLETGKFERPWIGLDVLFPPYIREVAAYVEFRERYRSKSLEIYGVRRNSPAEAAGFKKGDIIVDINGQHFATPEDVRLFLLGSDIGTPLNVRIIRNGVQLKAPIKINVGVKRSYDAEFSV